MGNGRLQYRGAIVTFVAVLMGLQGCAPAPTGMAERMASSKVIPIKQVASQLIERAKDDRVYSGQIRSEAGLAAFGKAYGVGISVPGIDFSRQMFIFGLSDQITTRAYQFRVTKAPRYHVLEYADSGTKYKLRLLKPDRKHSYLQVFLIDRMDNIPHISVRNLMSGLSRVYD